MTTRPAATLTPELQDLLDGTPIAHVATLLSDGAPHSVPMWIGTQEGSVVIMTDPGSLKARNLRRDPRIAISLTPPDNPFSPVALRGHVVGWLDGQQGWEVVDAISQKYVGQPYGRDQDRAVALVELDHLKMGM
jgi:PPOX class probable F420-dependent enzyme